MGLKFFDGGMGALLESSGYLGKPDLCVRENPGLIAKIHADYAAAGADFITTDTFGLNRLMLPGEDIYALGQAAVKLARAAGKSVAFDVGPLGRLLKPLGDLDFNEAYSAFAETVKASEGADVILVETMSDLRELKAAVLAAKENSNLPVFATVTLDERGRLLTGADIRSVVALLEGLGADALGCNCSQGAETMLPFVREFMKYAKIPVLVQPNAGLPDSSGKYNTPPEVFARHCKEIAELGVSYLGGCCGTTPAHIRRLTVAGGQLPVERRGYGGNDNLYVCSGASGVEISQFTVIGERLNPTGKPALKSALKSGDWAFVRREAALQEDRGAHILDVNCGVPGLDEAAVLTLMVEEIQSVTSLPLCLDSADPKALEAAMRVYNGVPLVNSVNGGTCEKILPLVRKYGGAVIALPLDERGVPETPAERLEIAKQIRDFGFKGRMLVDGLTLSAAADANAAKTTLGTLKLLRDEGFPTVLGLSNVSFGLPGRDTLNAAMLTLALDAGLTAAIVNPSSERLKDAVSSYNALIKGDFQPFIDRFSNVTPEVAGTSRKSLKDLIISGFAPDVPPAVRELLKELEPLAVIDGEIVPALNAVGELYEAGKVFLPGLLRSAEAAQAAFGELKARFPEKSSENKEKIVIAAVKGDVHDIGKNIAGTLLRNYGYGVIDLGKDVPPERVVHAVRETGARFVGLSALMTTTVPSMKDTIDLLRSEGLPVKVAVSGAVMNEEYARLVGADAYVKDALACVRFIKQQSGAGE